MDDTRPLVLVIDDDAGIRGLIRALLEDDGYEVTTSENGADALDALAREEAIAPALILLDLRMPVMDGPAFADAYLQRSASPAPIVLLSGDSRNSEATPWAAERIPKPFDIDRLLGAVRRALAP